MAKSTTVEEYRLAGTFQALRKTLLEPKHAHTLEKPLAYWALANDRRLPLAFLGRQLKDLLATPFDDLAATPGIGQKKIHSLVRLLSRAIKDSTPAATAVHDVQRGKRITEVELFPQPGQDFDPAVVSEALWSSWRETVRRHNLGGEKLGRVAPTLRTLPTVIWHTPLNAYLDHSVAEIRQLKTHGEKRVRAILEVFHAVHEGLTGLRANPYLGVQLVPKFVPAVQAWAARVSDGADPITSDDIREYLARPLIEQLEVDTNPTISRLAEGRLGLTGAAQTVRQQSRRMGVTRARVYQMLEDCGKVMHVRWPEGKLVMNALLERCQQGSSNGSRHVLESAVELFFPGKALSEEADTPAAAMAS